MTKIAIRTIAAAMSAITLGSSAPMAVSTTNPQVAQSTSSVTYTTELSDNSSSVEEMTVTTDAVPDNTYSTNGSDPELNKGSVDSDSIGSAICAYLMKPGDQKLYDDRIVLTFDTFQFVTEESFEDGWTKLSGYTLKDGDWEYWFSNARDMGDWDKLPFTVTYDGTAIGTPIATGDSSYAIDGFKFLSDDIFSYCNAPGAIFVYGNNWDAMILDYDRYEEVKYGSQTGNFPDRMDYDLVTYTSDHWVLAKGDYPSIELSELDELCLKIDKDFVALTGVSDPTYGAINWGEYAKENFKANSFEFDIELSGNSYKLEVDGCDVFGFTDNYNWSAAIVPSDIVAKQNDSILYYKDFAISADPNGGICVTDQRTGESRNLLLGDDPRNMDTAVMLFTVTDGKHATAFTARPELLSVMWALAAK